MSTFEARARAAKVDKMIGLIDSQAPCTSARDAVRTASWLSTLLPSQRAMLASAAGCTEPSEATWQLLVTTVLLQAVTT